jgi:hypothetical protein
MLYFQLKRVIFSCEGKVPFITKVSKSLSAGQGFLTIDTEVPGSILGAIRFSK